MGNPLQDSAASDPLIGSTIDGRYSIKGLLGEGGMGRVYDALHDSLERPVAIKVLGAVGVGEHLARFELEAKTASKLNHGNVVSVTDLGKLPDGRPYLVMPKIEGQDLRQHLATSGPWSPARVVELFSGVASALDLVHAKGILHRDIKPENLMYVRREDGSEALLLLDFGIATLLLSHDRITLQGLVCGTPDYMSPEAAQGIEVDHRADVYSLATVVFEMLAGRVPFSESMATLHARLLRPAPSLREVTGQPFDERIEAVMARGLERSKEDRYQSAGAMLSALASAVASAGSDAALPAIADTSRVVRRGLTLNKRETTRPDDFEPYLALAPTLVVALDEDHEIELPADVHHGSSLAWTIALLTLLAGAAVWLALPPTAPGHVLQRAAVEHEGTQEGPALHPQPSGLREPDPQLQLGPAPQPQAVAEPPASAPPEPQPGPERDARSVANAPTRVPVQEFPEQAPAELTVLDQPLSELTVADELPPDQAPPEQPPAVAIDPGSATAGVPGVATGSVIRLVPYESEAPVQLAVREEPEPGESAGEDQDSAHDSERAAELASQGSTELLSGRLSAAVASFTEAIRLDRQNTRAWRGLGISHEGLANGPAALHAYRRYLSLAPGAPDRSQIRGRIERLQEQGFSR